MPVSASDADGIDPYECSLRRNVIRRYCNDRSQYAGEEKLNLLRIQPIREPLWSARALGFYSPLLSEGRRGRKNRLLPLQIEERRSGV